MDGNVLDGAGILSGSPSMDPLQLHHHHHMSRQGRSLHGLSSGPVGLMPHLSTSLEQQQQQQQHQSLGFDGKNIQRSSSGKCRASLSEEDEPSFTEDGIDGAQNKGRKESSPWQRMKWSDKNVRLLIAAVLYVGEEVECGMESGSGSKRKSGILQKKGKWKSVSNLLNAKGCPVSPQQCEDKFNDLNKRFKRLNDVLGKGIACKVVENPALLDEMTHLSEKLKEDVRKILSSKHLFYREMCAYHTGNRLLLDADSGFQQNSMGMHCHGRGREGHEVFRAMGETLCGGACGGDDNEDLEEDEDEDEYDDEVGEEEGDPDIDGGMGDCMRRVKMNPNWEDMVFLTSPGSQDCGRPSAPESFNQELIGMLQDGTKTEWQKRQWMRNRAMQLEEDKLQIQVQAFELEKQRIKWKRLKSRKDRELDRLKLQNEKMKLENDRMALQLKHREIELEFKRSEATMSSGALIKMDRFRGMEQHDLGRGEPIQ